MAKPELEFEIDPTALANLDESDPFPINVGKNAYILLTYPDGSFSEGAMGEARDRAEAFCNSSNKDLVVVLDDPETVTIDGALKGVMYFACKNRE